MTKISGIKNKIKGTAIKRPNFVQMFLQKDCSEYNILKQPENGFPKC